MLFDLFNGLVNGIVMALLPFILIAGLCCSLIAYSLQKSAAARNVAGGAAKMAVGSVVRRMIR